MLLNEVSFILMKKNVTHNFFFHDSQHLKSSTLHYPRLTKAKLCLENKSVIVSLVHACYKILLPPPQYMCVLRGCMCVYTGLVCVSLANPQIGLSLSEK
jgi:hypothetical protein